MTDFDLVNSGVKDRETGRLGRPLPMDFLVIPERIELAEGNLVYRNPLDGTYRRLPPGQDLLTPFIQLAQSNPAAVLHFARSHGVLFLCEHGLPATHDPEPMTKLPMEDPEERWCEGNILVGGWNEEPVSTWQYFARSARAVINIAANLHQGRCGRPEDWATLHEREGLYVLHWPLEDIESEWNNLCEVVNQWLAFGNVRPRLRVEPPKRSPSMRLGGYLFGALAVQLMSAVTRTWGFAVCSACGGLYLPRRRPRRGQRHYCEACGVQAAWRDAQRAARAKRKKRQ